MPNPQHHDLITLQVKNNSVIANPETIGSQSRIFYSLSVFHGISLIAQKDPANTAPDRGLQLVDVTKCPLSINEIVTHEPKTLACLFTRPAL